MLDGLIFQFLSGMRPKQYKPIFYYKNFTFNSFLGCDKVVNKRYSNVWYAKTFNSFLGCDFYQVTPVKAGAYVFQFLSGMRLLSPITATETFIIIFQFLSGMRLQVFVFSGVRWITFQFLSGMRPNFDILTIREVLNFQFLSGMRQYCKLVSYN